MHSVTRVFPGQTGFEHNGNQYAPDIFYKWSKAEKEAIGIYEVTTDSTNYKDTKWYINTNESFTFANNTVTRSWGTAKQLKHMLILYGHNKIQMMEIYLNKEVGDVKVEDLKSN